MLVRYQLSMLNFGVIIVIDVAFCIKISVIRRIAFIRGFRFQRRAENSTFKSYIIPGASI
jgi:hypothetical protein